MKKRFLILLGVCLLVGCTNKPVEKSEKELTPEKAEENGNVVVLHKGETFEEIVQGKLEIKNTDKINQFLTSAENKKKASVNISIFEKNGNSHENKIAYDGDQFVFENNYGGYKQSPKGTFTCDYISQRGPIVYLETCKSKQGKDISTIIGFIGTEESFQ